MLEQKRLLSKVQVLGQENLGSPGVVWVSWAEVKAILSAVLVRSLRLLRCPKRSQTLEVPQAPPQRLHRMSAPLQTRLSWDH